MKWKNEYKGVKGAESFNSYYRLEYAQKGNAISVHINRTLIVNDVFMPVNAVVDGAGLIYTTEDSIRDELKSGKLEAMLEPYAATSTGFYLYY